MFVVVVAFRVATSRRNDAVVALTGPLGFSNGFRE